MVQCQIDAYSKSPGVKAASALEFIDILYYFDKRILSKFRSIVRVCTYSQYGVIYSILILKNQPFGRCRVALPALPDKDGIVNADICSFGHAFSP